MAVYLNDKAVEFSSGLTIASLLEQEGLGQLRGIALAVNDQVVPKAEWAGHGLSDNDKLTLIRATQGG